MRGMFAPQKWENRSKEGTTDFHKIRQFMENFEVNQNINLEKLFFEINY